MKKISSCLKTWKAASLTLRKAGKVNFLKIKKYVKDGKDEMDNDLKDRIAQLIGKIIYNIQYNIYIYIYIYIYMYIYI